jgi:hypothetical protein
MATEIIKNVSKADMLKYLSGDTEEVGLESEPTQREITGGTWIPKPDDDKRIKGTYVLPLRDGGLSFLLMRDGVVKLIELSSIFSPLMPEGVNGEVTLRPDDAQEMSLPVLTFSLPPNTKR